MTGTAVRPVHRYKPRGACAQLFAVQDGEVLLAGPAGTGKSRSCLEKLHLQAMKYPGMRGLILRKTHTSLTSTTLVTWREHVVREALETGEVKFYGGSKEEPAQYRYANGSSIVVGGLDNPTKIMSSEYDVAYIGEAIELSLADWEAVTTRLRNGVMPYQQLIADTNPDKDSHWLIRRCRDGNTLLLESRHEDNPVYVDGEGEYTERGRAYITGKLDKLTGVRYLRLRKGQWVSAEGVIYDEFDPIRHIIPRFAIPDDWTRYWTVDFGYVHPFTLQCWAEDPDGRLHLYREIYHTRRLVEDHARRILGLVRRPLIATPDWRDPQHWEWTEPHPTAIICDHDAEDRATLERHLGMSTSPARKTVSDGIQAVQVRLRPSTTGAGGLSPRILLLENSLVDRDPDLVDALAPTCVAEEFSGYVWADHRTKEEPVKEQDDGLDALRYMVADRDLDTAGSVRWL